MKLYWLLAVMLLYATAAVGQEFVFQGIVTDPDDRAVSGAAIHLDDDLIASCDNRGAFKLNGLPGGIHHLEFKSAGYVTYSDSIAIDNNIIDHIVVLKPTLEQPYDPVIPGEALDEIRFDRIHSVEIANPEFIMQNSGGSLMQSLERLPGVKSILVGPAQSKPLIRGMGFNRATVIENGIKHQGQQWAADHGLEIDQYTVDHLEIIKGPASLKYGSDAISGVVFLADPEIPDNGSWSGISQLSYRSNNGTMGGALNIRGRAGRFFTDARVSFLSYGDFKVPTDTLASASGMLRLQSGKVPNTAGRLSGFQIHTGLIEDRFSSVFHISYRTMVNGFFEASDESEETRVEKALSDDSDRDILEPFHNVAHLKVINRTVKHLNNQTLRLDLGYQHNVQSKWSEFNERETEYPFVPVETKSPPDLESNLNKQTISANFSDEINFDQHNFTIGVNTEHQRNDAKGRLFTIPDFTQFVAGAFAFDHLRINDKLLFRAGIRIDLGNIKVQPGYSLLISNSMPVADTTFVYIENVKALDRTFGNMSWSFGLNYNTDRLSLKGQFGKSFRMPLAQELAGRSYDPYFDIIRIGDTTLRPEESYQLDLCLEISHPGWAMKISPFFNYFTQYINLQPESEYAQSEGKNKTYHYRQNPAISAGGEILTQFRIIDNLRAGVTGEYIYQKLMQRDANMYTFIFTPRPSLTLNLNYRPEWDKGIFYDTFISIDFRITPQQPNFEYEEWNTTGYNILNLSAGTKIKWGNQPFEIYIQARNLFNTRYFNPASYYYYSYLPEPGRDFVISLKIPFQMAGDTR